MTMLNLLGICGALRAGSTNRKLLNEAVHLYGPCTYAEADLRLPLYDGDLEDATGIPPEVQRLADQIAAADGVIIASPEYNKAITGVLKNALDWVSRVSGNPWLNKPVAVMSANAGRTGGETGQYTLRHALTPFRAHLVTGPMLMVAESRAEFGEGTQLQSERYIKTLTALMESLRAEISSRRSV